MPSDVITRRAVSLLQQERLRHVFMAAALGAAQAVLEQDPAAVDEARDTLIQAAEEWARS